MLLGRERLAWKNKLVAVLGSLIPGQASSCLCYNYNLCACDLQPLLDRGSSSDTKQWVARKVKESRQSMEKGRVAWKKARKVLGKPARKGKERRRDAWKKVRKESKQAKEKEMVAWNKARKESRQAKEKGRVAWKKARKECRHAKEKRKVA